MPTWHCGSRTCPTHARPADRCGTGVWTCARLDPPCSGHSRPEHQEGTGRLFHCGAVGCRTHLAAGERCRDRLWLCGRQVPFCRGHRSPDDRCEAGAAARPLRTMNGAPLGRRIVEALRSAPVGRINVTMFGVGIAEPDFRAVADAIELHRLSVACTFAGHPFAHYGAGLNALIVHDPAFPASPREIALLVHEAVHAILDLRRRSLPRVDDEVLAYTVQMAYLIRAGVDDWSTLDPARVPAALRTGVANCVAGEGDQTCRASITLASFMLARALLAGRPPPAAHLAEARRVIPLDALYRAEDMSLPALADGVPPPAWQRGG